VPRLSPEPAWATCSTWMDQCATRWLQRPQHAALSVTTPPPADSKSRRPSSLRTPGALAKLVMRLTISYVDGVVGEVLAAAGTTDMGHQGGDDDTATSGREVPAVPPMSKSQDGADDELRGDDGQHGRLTPPGARTVRNTRADAFSPHWVAATGKPTSHCRWAIASLL
jgi:hypothetical protein